MRPVCGTSVSQLKRDSKLPVDFEAYTRSAATVTHNTYCDCSLMAELCV